MEKILSFIEKETKGRCFASAKYCFDSPSAPAIEYEDQGMAFQNFKDFAENNHDENARNLTHKAKMLLSGPPLFKFFLDGSRKVYKVNDILYNNKVYPVVSGQISVACCEREMNDDNTYKTFHKREVLTYPVISLPVTANSSGVSSAVFSNQLCEKINELPLLQNNNLRVEKVLNYSTNLQGEETFENKAIATIQDEMIECEKRLVQSLVSQHLLTQDSYLVKDGSIQYKEMKGDGKAKLVKNNYRHVVGVSKKFNPNLMKDRKDKSNAGQIASLPLYHRSPAFLWEPGGQCEGKYAIWYVRIHSIKHTDTPFAGIVKVEKMLITDKEKTEGLDSELIDVISANIINERNPVCYGTDSRWANHLYPIYLTERYCKSLFKSDYYFLNLF